MPTKNDDRTLANQIITFIFFYLAIIFITSIGSTFFIFSRIMLANSRDSISHLTTGTINEIDARLDKVSAIARDAYVLHTTKLLDENTLNSYIHGIINEYPEISSVCIAYDPSLTKVPNARTLFQEHNEYLMRSETNTDYQFMDWFQIPFYVQKNLWTEPWFDSYASEKYLISYCLPIYKEGKAIGIMRFDTDLSYLQSLVSPLRIKKSGYAFLISKLGTIITHPTDSFIMNESIFSLAEYYDDADLRKIGKSMIAGDVNFVQIKGKSIFQDSWIYFAPLLSNNWSLGIVIANSDVTRDLRLILVIQVFISILVFLAISIIVYSRTKNVSKPLRKFTELAENIGKGDFNSSLPETGSTYEIVRLSKSFGAMQASLKDYIKNLEVTNLEKNSILTEVRFAAEIQKNLIPSNTEHPFGINSLRVFGVFEPASEIGGDLYDYFMLDESHFCFAIADVVGKGIVAAMTMTIVSTFLRSSATHYSSSNRILQELNNYLCYNNIEANFVTVLLGIININNGVLEFSNAGHVPMFIRKMDRTYKKFSETHTTAMGVFENLPIEKETVQLDIGDEIILFTDGITEAMNANDEFLGISGVEEIILKLGNPDPEKSANTILQRVHDFASNKSSRDDITILAIDYRHPNR
ncbi:MAG: SpoIIE family protein phosphatase [Candidatus Cloacimonetes bacterium]|nr:SpoIIE family protein phosphatase [Candidatus Cloacimonadota bacterium]